MRLALLTRVKQTIYQALNNNLRHFCIDLDQYDSMQLDSIRDLTISRIKLEFIPIFVGRLFASLPAEVGTQAGIPIA